MYYTREYLNRAHREIDTIFRVLFPEHGMAVREEQIMLCHEMLDNLLGRNIALCDAGVGIGKTYAYLYHHFSSKDDILDAIEDKLLVENNPFKKVLVYSELTGIELIKKAFLLGIEDQEQQYYNKISMKIWRQSEKIQSPKMIAKMIEINKNILAPDLCKIVEKGIKDGSVDTKYPMEISEQILLQINIGLLLAISDITEKELTGKIEFISEWTKNMGVDFLDKELKEKLKHVFMEYCE